MNVQQEPESTEPREPEIQEGRKRGIARDEKLKRIVKQHPQRDIPQVESVEPSEAPPKE